MPTRTQRIAKSQQNLAGQLACICMGKYSAVQFAGQALPIKKIVFVMKTPPAGLACK